MLLSLAFLILAASETGCGSTRQVLKNFHYELLVQRPYEPPYIPSWRGVPGRPSYEGWEPSGRDLLVWVLLIAISALPFVWVLVKQIYEAELGKVAAGENGCWLIASSLLLSLVVALVGGTIIYYASSQASRTRSGIIVDSLHLFGESLVVGGVIGGVFVEVMVLLLLMFIMRVLLLLLSSLSYLCRGLLKMLRP